MNESWESNRRLINGLWPEADFTPDERDLFHKAFCNLNQEWLKEAIERAAMDRMGKKPYVAWIKKEFNSIKAEKTIPNFRNEIHKKSDVQNDREGEFSDCRKFIKQFPGERIEEGARRIKAATGVVVDVTDDVENWSMMAVGLMAAFLEKGNV